MPKIDKFILGKSSILIVEDDLQLANLFAEALKLRGLNAICVYHGDQVMDIFKNHKIALVLLDIMLPGTDGFQLLKMIKNNRKTKNIPVIMLTNFGEIELMQKALHMGAADYLIKANMDFPKIFKFLKKHLIGFNARMNLHRD